MQRLPNDTAKCDWDISAFILMQDIIRPCPDQETAMKKYKFNNSMSLLHYPSCFISIYLENCSLLLLLILGTLCDLLEFCDVHHEMSSCYGHIRK